MLFYKSRFLFFSLFFLVTFRSSATHIVGGELNYTDLGGGTYRVRLIVYRDCFNGQAAFDDPASIGVFDSNNNLVQNLLVNLTTQAHIPNLINSPCLQPPSNICYEYAEYITTVFLPPTQGGYQLAYQRCCRNGTIGNLFNVGNTGATYYATIPDPAVVAVNSNPRFTNLPPTFICLNAPLHFDHSAIDHDGDSLVYSLCTPHNGATNFSPRPQPPGPPPYGTVIFQPPYSFSDPLGGVPMLIDAHSGMLTATPNHLGQFVYGVRVQEFRNGVLIGETIRDYQVNVVPCPNITVASIFSPTIVCGSLEAHFVNNSFNANFFEWNFGDPTSFNDTSTIRNPIWTYPDTGIYHATLIAHSPINPLCTDTAIGEIRVYPDFFTRFAVTNQHCSNEFDFHDQSFGINGTANYWHWNFGDGHFSPNPDENHQYANPGTYNVVFISSTDSGCTDTSQIAVHVLAIPRASFISSVDTCHLSVTLTNQSTLASHYTWSFGDGNFSPAPNEIHSYGRAGTFTVILTAISDSSCFDTSQVTIDLPPLPVASFNPQHALCDSVVTFSNSSLNAIHYFWDYGDGNSSDSVNTIYRYPGPGTYNVQLISSSVHCSDRSIQPVIINAVPFAEFYHPFICGLTADFTNLSRRADFYSWSFGDNSFSSDISPTHEYNSWGWYRVELRATTSAGCADTAAQLVHALPVVTSLFSPGIVECNPEVSFANQSANGHQYRWDFGDGRHSFSPNPNHLFDSTGTYVVRLIVNPGICADTSEQTVSVTKTPVASFTHEGECGTTIHLRNTSTGNVFNNWNFGDGTHSGETNPEHMFNATDDTEYIVTLEVATNEACFSSSTARIPVQLPTIAAFTPFADTCEATIRLVNQSTHAKNYLWNWDDGTFSSNVNDMHQYKSSGFYNISLITNPETVCADTMDQTVFAYGTNESSLYIPDAFTPNGDGTNDLFVISGYNRCLFYNVSVFNRWGEKIFETDDISNSWDGRYSGKDAEAGIYVYVIKGIDKELMGNVMILR